MATNDQVQIYHEKQRLQFCLLHSLNNLFQEKDAFTRSSLNSTADKLVHDDPNKAPFSILFKPHHNAITGNYDINVLMAALEEKGKSVVWHDRRNGADSIEFNDDLMGIVLNVPVRRYAGLWRGRHWIAMREIGGVWYNLDSDMHRPEKFKDDKDVREFLDYVLSHGGEILLVKNVKD
ncbi:hypothetical protein ACFE04_011630 [Oxalis oulophora]